MNIRIGAELTQETVRCIYCKKPLNESATWYEQSLQVHMTCKNQIEEYQRNKGKLPEEVYKEYQEFFKKKFELKTYLKQNKNKLNRKNT